jgi:hypothetical protein
MVFMILINSSFAYFVEIVTKPATNRLKAAIFPLSGRKEFAGCIENGIIIRWLEVRKVCERSISRTVATASTQPRPGRYINVVGNALGPYGPANTATNYQINTNQTPNSAIYRIGFF